MANLRRAQITTATGVPEAVSESGGACGGAGQKDAGNSRESGADAWKANLRQAEQPINDR